MLRGKRGGKATKRGTSREQVPVLIARDRAGATANIALDATTAKDMDAAPRPILPDDTVLCTDGSSALATAARRLGVEHHAVDLSAGVRVNGARHLQKGSAFAPGSWLAAPLQRRGDPLPRELPRLVPRARPVARIYSGTRVAPRIGGQGMSASSTNWKWAFIN